MSTPVASSLPRAARAGARAAGRARSRWPRPELRRAARLLAGGALTSGRSSRNGFANEYYSAAVRSMSSELARVPLRLVRRRRRHDRRQAAARALGPGAVGAGVRLQLVEHARAAGADGRGQRRRSSTTSTRRRFGRAAGFVAGLVLALTPIDGRDLAPQQPGRAARAVLRRGAVVRSSAALEDGRTRWLVLSRRLRRPRLRDEDGARRCWSCPALAAAWLWVAPRGRARGAAPARGAAARRWPSSGWPGRCWSG